MARTVLRQEILEEDVARMSRPAWWLRDASVAAQSGGLGGLHVAADPERRQQPLARHRSRLVVVTRPAVITIDVA